MFYNSLEKRSIGNQSIYEPPRTQLICSPVYIIKSLVSACLFPSDCNKYNTPYHALKYIYIFQLMPRPAFLSPLLFNAEGDVQLHVQLLPPLLETRGR